MPLGWRAGGADHRQVLRSTKWMVFAEPAGVRRWRHGCRASLSIWYRRSTTLRLTRGRAARLCHCHGLCPWRRGAIQLDLDEAVGAAACRKSSRRPSENRRAAHWPDGVGRRWADADLEQVKTLSDMFSPALMPPRGWRGCSAAGQPRPGSTAFSQRRPGRRLVRHLITAFDHGAGLSISSRMSQIQPASSRHSVCLKPRW